MFGLSKKNYEKEMNRTLVKRAEDIKYGRKEVREYAAKKKAEQAIRKARIDRPVGEGAISRLAASMHRVVKGTEKAVSRKGAAYAYGGLRVNVSSLEDSSKKRVKSGPGRPREVYIHRDPRTGQSIPAAQYYKVIRAIKNQQKIQAEQARIKYEAMLARRGIPPPRIQSYRQGAVPQYPQQVQTQPQQQYPQQAQAQVQMQRYPQQIQRVPMRQVQSQSQMQAQLPYRVVVDPMTGRKILKPLPPRERWLG